MTAVDTPDTRSWSTLPARIAFGRQQLPAGPHTVSLAVAGVQKRQIVNVQKHGWTVIVLTVLR
jgi:hypothetical protein